MLGYLFAPCFHGLVCSRHSRSNVVAVEAFRINLILNFVVLSHVVSCFGAIVCLTAITDLTGDCSNGSKDPCTYATSCRLAM